MAKRERRRGRSGGEQAPASTPRADARRSELQTPILILAAIAVLVGCRPIEPVDLWWEASRGREVASGQWAPSRALLTEESQPDADWLGGLPIYFAYQLAGFSGWMLMRLAAAAAVAWMAWQRVPGDRWRRCLTAGALVLAVSPALDPSALYWDLLGLLVLGLLVELWHRGRWPLALAAVAGWMMLWANLGPRCLVGLLALVGWAWPGLPQASSRTPRQYVAILVASTAACLLTPRLLGTLADSLQLTFNGWTTEGAWLVEGPWQPVLSDIASPQLAGFLLITALALPELLRGAGGPAAVYGFVLAQLLAWHNVGNLALGAVLLVMSPHRATAIAVIGEGLAVGTRSATRRSVPWRSAAAAVVLVIAAGLQAGRGVGWGLSEQLDIRFLSRALEGQRLAGTAFADRIATAGMLAWEGHGVVVQDAPHRALLGGRSRDFRLLLSDLKQQFRAAYQRTDGSQGGWWLSLMGRDTVLLLVTAENVALIEGLYPTLWRPLAIDGPVIPFAPAGHPQLTAVIVNVLRQQDFVETGGWTYQPPQSTLSEYDRDWWGLRPVRDDTQLALRQANLFRALGLPRAALQVLRHLQRSGRAALAQELVAACQADLMEWEIRRAGRASQFRSLAWQAAMGEPLPQPEDHLSRAAVAYVAGEFDAALKWIADDPSPASRYGRAVLLLESGRVDQSLGELRALYDELPGETVGILAGALARLIAAEPGEERQERGRRDNL